MSLDSIFTDIWNHVAEAVESVREAAAEAKHSICSKTKLCETSTLSPKQLQDPKELKKVREYIRLRPSKSIKLYQNKKHFKALSPEQIQELLTPQQRQALEEFRIKQQTR